MRRIYSTCVCAFLHTSSVHLIFSKLVIDKYLSALPQRETDGAAVIRAQDAAEGKARVFKLNTVVDDAVLISRYTSNEACSVYRLIALQV
jgi:hypothetical protein